MLLSIIILNYKQKGLVKQCLRGILQSRPGLDYEIIVVDNNSGDGCLEMASRCVLVSPPTRPMNHLTSGRSNEGDIGQCRLRERDSDVRQPRILTIAAPKNLGFAAGNNLGIKKSQGKYVMILNPDVAVVSGALEKMCNFMEQNPGIGMLGPKLINPDGTVQYSCRRFPNWQIPIFRRTIFGRLPVARKKLNHFLMQDFNHQTNQPVDWLFGACLLLRKKALDQAGLLDEHFFMYFEDLDLCRRFWQAGFQVWYLSEVELVHYHQRLSAENSGLLSIFSPTTQIHITSGIKYFAKYLGDKSPR